MRALLSRIETSGFRNPRVFLQFTSIGLLNENMFVQLARSFLMRAPSRSSPSSATTTSVTTSGSIAFSVERIAELSPKPDLELRQVKKKQRKIVCRGNFSILRCDFVVRICKIECFLVGPHYTPFEHRTNDNSKVSKKSNNKPIIHCSFVVARFVGYAAGGSIPGTKKNLDVPCVKRRLHRYVPQLVGHEVFD